MAVGDRFPTAILDDVDVVAVDFPAIFTEGPSTVVFFIGIFSIYKWVISGVTPFGS